MSSWDNGHTFESFRREPPFEQDGVGLAWDGKLWFLFVHDGAGHHSTYPTEETIAGLAVALLKALSTDDARRDVLKQFCSHCGGEAGCQCWNDE